MIHIPCSYTAGRDEYSSHTFKRIFSVRRKYVSDLEFMCFFVPVTEY